MPSKSIPDIILERMALGELSSQELELWGQRQSESVTREQLKSLADSNQEILTAYAPSTMVAAISRKARREKTRSRLFKIGALAMPLAATAALLLFYMQPENAQHQWSEPNEVTRLKGSSTARLIVYRNQEGQALRLKDNALVQANDVVQISYIVSEQVYGVVLSIDGDGNVTLHLPEQGHRAEALKIGAEVPLAHAYQLDDARDYERFFLLTSQSQFSVELALDAARQLVASGSAQAGQLDLPDDIAQASLTLRKGVVL